MKRISLGLFSLIFTIILIFSVSVPIIAVDAPNVKRSTAALVYCVESDELLWSKDADRRLYPAALTKLMTAVLAAEYSEAGNIGLDDTVTATDTALKNAVGNNIGIVRGEKLKYRDLIGAMILTGANDAALILAETIAGGTDAFVELMNKRAEELGMTNTVYTNPTGLHDDNMLTTATDLLTLAKYANRILLLSDIFRAERITVDPTNKSEIRYIGNRNYLVSERFSTEYYLPMATGMICGSTYEAGFCIVATGQKDGLNYISVVLGSDTTTVEISPATPEFDENGNPVLDENGDPVIKPAENKYIINGFVEASELLSWSAKNFKYISVIDKATPICQIKVKLAEAIDNVTLLPEEPIEIFVPVDVDKDKIEVSWELDSEYLTAPVKSGFRAGTVTVAFEGKLIGSVPLVVKTNIEQSGTLTVLNRIEQLAKTPFFVTVIVVIAVGAVIYVFATAVTRSRRKAAARREFIKKNRYLNKGK